MNNIILNVVTVVWNDIEGLEKTLNSLLRLYNSSKIFFKIRVQDGDSFDGTNAFAQKFIKKHSKKGFEIILCSESDNGIFDAMNKASSDFRNNDMVLYLNAGDIISEEIIVDDFYDSLESFAESDYKIAAYRYRNIANDISYYMPSKKVKKNEQFFKWLINNTPVHQALIFKYDKNFGIHYPLNFKIQSDSIMIFYLFKFQGNPIFFNNTLCDFELGGLSNSYKSLKKVITQIREQNIVSKLRNESIFFVLLRIMSLFSKFILYNLIGDKFTLLHAYLKKIISNN